jgi:hypothetical protein
MQLPARQPESTSGHRPHFDVDHRTGTVGTSFRPNRYGGRGGIPFPLLTGVRAWRVTDALETRSLMP